MSEIISKDNLQDAAGALADFLPLYRIYRGRKTANMLAHEYRDPASRTWRFAGRVAFDASTDFIDGKLARFAGATRLGGYLDQMSDKIWFLMITRQLVNNGEIDLSDYWVPLARDAVTSVARPAAQYFGLQTDAGWPGKIKMNAQVLAAVSACSPLADEYPEFVQTIYRGATFASAVSGTDLLVQYAEEFKDRYKSEPLPVLIGQAALQLAAAA